MMRIQLKVFSCAILALLLVAPPSHAGTIIKLDLGGTGPDVQFSGGQFGLFRTEDDGDLGTLGDQDTTIRFSDFLSSLTPNPTTGSYLLTNVNADGTAPVPLGGGVLKQGFSGGFFALYDSSNSLLLQVNLGNSLLVGGSSGAFFNITNGTVVGGSLAPLLSTNSIGMSLSLTNISGGGLSTGIGGFLNAFQADATKEISANPVPEPGTLLLACGAILVPALLRRRR
jgi:hypothetical protein